MEPAGVGPGELPTLSGRLSLVIDGRGHECARTEAAIRRDGRFRLVGVANDDGELVRLASRYQADVVLVTDDRTGHAAAVADALHSHLPRVRVVRWAGEGFGDPVPSHFDSIVPECAWPTTVPELLSRAC
jgi:hypothetical protein